MIDRLQTILADFHAIAQADTAFGDYDPALRGKLHGHCGCVTFALQKIFGGQIVSGKIAGESHLWNDFGGIEVDCCAEQFGQAPIVFFQPGGRLVKPRKTINPRFQLFWDRYQTHIQNENH